MEESAFRQRAIAMMPALSPGSASYPWLILFTVMFGTFMVVLDGTIINVAIPSIMASFGVTLSEVVWVSTSYLIALSVLLAVSGWLADHFGAKKVYIFGLLVFTASSYLCGIAWSLHALIFFRVIQGIGGGVLIPVGMSLFSKEFPPEKRTVSLGYYSIAIAAAISLGPSLGGWILDQFKWGWIFFINIPVGILTFLAAVIIFKTSYKTVINGFDFWGMGSLTAFLVALLTAISSGNAPWNAEGWTSRFTIISFLIAAVGFAIFLFVEIGSSDPIVNLSVYRDRNFFIGNLVLFIFSFTLFGSSFLLPLYLQNGLDYSKLSTGLILLPLGLSQGIVGPLAGYLTKKIGGKFLVVAGIVFLAITYYLNSKFTLYTQESTMFWVFTLRGVAMGLMFTPLVSITLSTIPEKQMAQATGVFAVQRQVGAVMGVAVFETILVNRQIYHNAIYGSVISEGTPIFVDAQASLEGMMQSQYGSNIYEAAVQAKQLILANIDLHVFVQAIADNILLACLITISSCIPLFFLRKKV